MSEHAVNAEGLRVFDPANLPPLKVTKRKVPLSNTSSCKEAILRGAFPENVVSFHQYVAKRNLEISAFGSGHPKSDFETRLLSRLYRQFVSPWFPPTIKQGHQTIFVKHTIPHLMDATCREAAYILSAMFHHRNKASLKGIPKALHMQECAVAISQVPSFSIPKDPRTRKLRTARQRDALRIVMALAAHSGGKDALEGCFYLAARDLQARLLLPDHKTALRILHRFCDLGILAKVEVGKVRWEALRAGEPQSANAYRLEI